MKSKKIIIVLLVILVMSHSPITYAENETNQTCTIITVKDSNRTLFLNNEDNSEMHQGRVYFFPATKERNGLVMFGYRYYDFLDIWVGGMNDQGLCFDQNAVPYTIPAEHPEKEKLNDLVSLKMLESCSNVSEVRRNIVNYWGWSKIADQQIHFADTSGDACVFGLDVSGELHMSNITDNSLISTNIELAQHDSQYIYDHCWRYRAAHDLIEFMPALTIDYARSILETVVLPMIMYSYIIDLSSMKIYLYAQGDFQHETTIDVNEELAKGKHSYSIDDLVKNEHGVSEYNFTIANIFIFFIVIGLNVVFYFRITRSKFRNVENQIKGRKMHE